MVCMEDMSCQSTSKKAFFLTYANCLPLQRMKGAQVKDSPVREVLLQLSVLTVLLGTLFHQ